MKKLMIVLFSLLIYQGTVAQNFSGSAIGFTVGKTKQVFHTNPSFIHILNSVYFELGSGTIENEQYVNLGTGYAIEAGTHSYIVPTISVNVDKGGIKWFSGGAGINLITQFSERCFVITGVGVNQPAKIGIGYKF